MLPTKPSEFHPEKAPYGVEIKFVDFWRDRPKLMRGPTLQLVHTNGAPGEGTVTSAWNWAHAKPHVNTCPHYQVDRERDGILRARKMLPSDRRGIANATMAEYEGPWGDVSWWSLAIETADLGWPVPGTTCGFSPMQGEMIATILAYESITSPTGIPLEYPKAWYAPGTACHTEPFGNPYWTLYIKPCPGLQKKKDMREWIIPRARIIKAAWTAGEEVEEMADFWRDERYHDVFQIRPSVAFADGASIKAAGNPAVIVGRHQRMLRSLAKMCEVSTVSRNTGAGNPGNWEPVPVDMIPDVPD